MSFLYILSRLRNNAFKRILQRYIRIGFGSGGVWRWLCTSAAVPGLLPGYSRRAVCSAPVYQIAQGDGTFAGSRWWPVADRLAVPRAVLRWDKGIKGMYDKSETESNPDRFEMGKSEKNRRNLRLIQTCDFFILCILYIISYNVSRRDVNFSFQHIQLIVFHIFPSYGTSNLGSSSLLPDCFFFSAFCRILADCSHACCSFPYISFIF